jgi:glyoxylase-like metal-dependent hydrolase (beta-lactamase superfamily II)
VVVEVGGALFVGDLFRGSIIGRRAHTHFYMCDLQDNADDIDALLQIVPDATVFFPGHFGPVRRSAVERWRAGGAPAPSATP